jgi:hypothetical protein
MQQPAERVVFAIKSRRLSRQRLGNSRMRAADPFISATGVAGELCVALITARRAIELQQRMEIARLTTEAERERIYYA